MTEERDDVAITTTGSREQSGLDAETLRSMYRHMLRSRLLDERLWALNRQGRAPFWISTNEPIFVPSPISQP